MSKKRISHGFLYADGTLEVTSNDNGLKIILSRIKVIKDGKNAEAFRTTYSAKDGLEWERTLESAFFKTSDEFLEAISRSNDFSEAVNDLTKQKR